MSQRFDWGHININVSDLDVSIEFYTKLGFQPFIFAIPYLNLNGSEPANIPDSATEALGLPPNTRGRACIMQLNDGFPKIDLTELKDLPQRPPLKNVDIGIARLCLVSQDIQADYEYLSREGVRFLSPPTACHDRLGDLACCVDPDGTLIELLQVYLDRWGPYLA